MPGSHRLRNQTVNWLHYVPLHGEKINVVYYNWTNNDYGWGGDSDARFYDESYDEETLKDIKNSIMEQHGYTSADQITNDDFSLYVGEFTSTYENTYTYDKASGIDKSEHSFSLE